MFLRADSRFPAVWASSLPQHRHTSAVTLFMSLPLNSTVDCPPARLLCHMTEVYDEVRFQEEWIMHSGFQIQLVQASIPGPAKLSLPQHPARLLTPKSTIQVKPGGCLRGTRELALFPGQLQDHSANCRVRGWKSLFAGLPAACRAPD